MPSIPVDLHNKTIAANTDLIRELCHDITTIYTDVDGTLLGPTGSLFLDSLRKWTIKPAESIVTVLERGVDVVMVSGRNQMQLLETARVLGFQNYIAEMGTLLIYERGARHVLNLGGFDPGKYTAYEAMQASGALDHILDEFPGRIEYHLPWSKTRDCTALLRGLIDTDEVNNSLVAAGFGDFYIIDNGKIGRKSPTLDLDELHAYHVIPRGVSKEQAVALDQELRRIPQEKSIAIGDSVADLAFASEVAAFFMPANGIYAHPEISSTIAESKNTFIAENEMNLGWAEVIGAIFK